MEIKALFKKNKRIFFIVKFIKIRILKINSEIDVILLKKLKFNTSIDIGSNYGSYTSVLRKISRSVISVEPNTSILNFQKKILGNKNIIYENVAVGEIDKKVSLNIPYKNKTLIYEEAFISNSILNENSLSVNQKNGDKLFFNLKYINFIKIDVEGYENNVIKSLTNTIENRKPILLIEIESRHSNNAKIDSLINFLYKIDYVFYYMENGKRLKRIKKIDSSWVSKKQSEENYLKDKKKSLYKSTSTKNYINNFWCIHKNQFTENEKILTQFGVSFRD